MVVRSPHGTDAAGSWLLSSGGPATSADAAKRIGVDELQHRSYPGGTGLTHRFRRHDALAVCEVWHSGTARSDPR